MTCKTREKHDYTAITKPHYYLENNKSRQFMIANNYNAKSVAMLWDDWIKDIEMFESKIDWSTWGR